jgi:hypothetical protein
VQGLPCEILKGLHPKARQALTLQAKVKASFDAPRMSNHQPLPSAYPFLLIA